MPKDLKIGMALGVAVAIAAVLWVSTRPKFSTAMLNSRDSSPGRAPGTAEQDPEHDLPSPQLEAGQESPAESPAITARRGVQEVPDSTIYEQTQKIVTERFHIVRKGETLSEISSQYYGSPGKWSKIVRANPRVIKDVDKVLPGTKLIIPE